MAVKGKAIAKSLFVAFILAIAILFSHYLYFESKRLEACGIDLFKDWRSYIAYVMSKIPYVKDRVQYTPLKIGSPAEYYKEVMEGVLVEVGKRMEEVERKEKEVEKLKSEYEAALKALNDIRSRLEEKIKEVEQVKEVYISGQEKVKELADLLKVSDPEEIAPTLAQDSISIDTLAAALSLLPKDLSAEMIQALSKVNSPKAAKVIARIGSVEGIIQRIKEEEGALSKKLEEYAKVQADLLSLKAFRETLKGYFMSMDSYEVADLLSKLNLTTEELVSVLNLLSAEKRAEVLRVLQRNFPEIFRKLVERGVGS